MGDVDLCYGTGDGRLKVLGKPAATAEGSESSLDDLAARQHFDVARGIGALDYLAGPAADFCQGVAEFVTGIAAVDEHVSQPGLKAADQGDDALHAAAVLNVGGMDQKTYEMAFVDVYDVALTALDLSVGAEGARGTALRGFHRLAIDDVRHERGLAARVFARRHDQHVIDPEPRPVTRPMVDLLLHRRTQRKLLRQPLPLATNRGHIVNRVRQRSKIGLPRTPDAVPTRQQWHNQRPLLVGHIACVAQPIVPIRRPSDLGPGHYDL